MSDKKTVKVACYIRVSTLEQKKNWYWKDLQLNKLQKYIEFKSDDWWVFDENLLYQDLWISWAKGEEDRIWLKKLRQDIEDDKIDVVLVWKIDRIARNTGLLLELVDCFNKHNIAFISCEESIDTKSPNWKFFLTILWAFAEMERSLIAEKTFLWKLEALKKWKYVFWSPPFWFLKDPNKKLIISDEEKEIVEKIFNLYTKEDKSISEISKILTFWWYQSSFDNKLNRERKVHSKWKWTHSFISRILNNEIYIWKLHLNKHENIKDKKTWKNIKKIKKWRRLDYYRFASFCE